MGIQKEKCQTFSSAVKKTTNFVYTETILMSFVSGDWFFAMLIWVCMDFPKIFSLHVNQFKNEAPSHIITKR